MVQSAGQNHIVLWLLMPIFKPARAGYGRRTLFRLSCLALLLLLPAGVSAAKPAFTREAQALVERVLPAAADRFSCEAIPEDHGQDVFEFEAVKGRIVLRGNSGLSLAMALNWYLRYEAKTSYDWRAAGPLQLAGALPLPAAKTRRTCAAQERFFLNYCTFGYTFPFTDWNGWQRFIDWMALNGINRPLLQCGQEAVWYRVWKSYGLTDPQIRGYFSGPAHLPWHRMANLDTWAGPLPTSYLDGQMKLQRQILGRARALGMQPILSGFAGHVPEALQCVKPGAKITRIKPGWGGMEAKYATWFLAPTDPLFSEVQVRFLKAQTALYGSDHLYAADPFNEITPPSWEPAYMASVARSIYEGMTAGDPKAVWYQMSWTFGYGKYPEWLKKTPAGETPFAAMANAVPKGRMVFLDYVGEEKELYRLTEGFADSPFIWNYLANFGGCTYQLAPVEKISERITKALPLTNCRGVGSTLEGLGVNPVGYDLTLEQPWHANAAVDYRRWIADYAARRAGREDAAVIRAWQILTEKTLINQPLRHHDRGSGISMRPALDTKNKVITADTARVGDVPVREPALVSGYVEAIDELFKASPESQQADGYRFDSVNWVRQALAYHCDNVRSRMLAAYKRGDLPAFRTESARLLQMIQDLDTLVGTRHEFLLGTWIQDARAWGKGAAEADYYEANARQILTTWYQAGSALTDYCRREWNGLLSSYYLPRWEEFIKRLDAALVNKQAYDTADYNRWRTNFEEHWVTLTNTKFPTTPQGNSVATARKLFGKYRAELLTSGKPHQLP